MAFQVCPRGHGRGIGQGDAITKELQELKERVAGMER